MRAIFLLNILYATKNVVSVGTEHKVDSVSVGMGSWGGAWGWDSGDGSTGMGAWGWEPFFWYFEILLTIYLFHFFQLN